MFSTLPALLHGLKTYFLQKPAHTSVRKNLQEVPYSTHTSLILPLDAASGLVIMAGRQKQWGRVFFCRGGGSVLYLVSLSGAAETTESQLGRVNERSNIRKEGPRSRGFPPNDDHVSGAREHKRQRGEMLHCSPLPSSPLSSNPHY